MQDGAIPNISSFEVHREFLQGWKEDGNAIFVYASLAFKRIVGFFESSDMQPNLATCTLKVMNELPYL